MNDMNQKTYVSLDISSETVTSAEVTAMLGLNPTTQREIGERVSDKVAPSRRSVWSWHCLGDENIKTLEQKCNVFQKKITVKKDAIKRLMGQADIKISIVINDVEEFPELIIPFALSSLCADVGIDIWVECYIKK